MDIIMDIYTKKTELDSHTIPEKPAVPHEPNPDEKPGPGTWPHDDIDYRRERKDG